MESGTENYRNVENIEENLRARSENVRTEFSS